MIKDFVLYFLFSGEVYQVDYDQAINLVDFMDIHVGVIDMQNCIIICILHLLQYYVHISKISPLLVYNRTAYRRHPIAYL